MLGRRKPRSRVDQTIAWIWPRRGVRGAGRYILRRLARIKGSPHAIAVGVACGAGVSFLPLPGLHFVLGGLMAWGLRGSLIASAVGTIVGNPWTFPLIWIGSYRLGRMLGVGDGIELGEGALGVRLAAVFRDIWQGRIMSAAVDSWPVLGPTLVGGAILGAVAGGLFYLATRKAVAAYQAGRRERMAAGRARTRAASLLLKTREESQA